MYLILSHLKTCPACKCTAEGGFIDKLEFGAHRNSIGDSGYIHLVIQQQFIDVVRCSLAFASGFRAKMTSSICSSSPANPLQQLLDANIVRANIFKR